jgi:hypothetical protein
MLSSVTLFVLAFACLGLLLGFASSHDNTELVPHPGTAIENRDPALQAKSFDKCISDSGEDGAVSEEEYNACAYEIYG